MEIGQTMTDASICGSGAVRRDGSVECHETLAAIFPPSWKGGMTMDDQIKLTIDGIEIAVPADSTILQAATGMGIEIPTICYHEHTTSNALCRICVVEVEGSRVLVPSCTGKVSEGMKVQTSSARVQQSRKTILEMMAATIDLSESPEILEMFPKYHADENRFP